MVEINEYRSTKMELTFGELGCNFIVDNQHTLSQWAEFFDYASKRLKQKVEEDK